MSGLRDALHDRGLLAHITLPPEVDTLLEGLQPAQPVGLGDDVRGTATPGLDASPLGFLSLTLTPPSPSVPFHLVSDPVAGSFRLWLVLNEAAPAKALFGLAAGVTGSVLTPAVINAAGDQEWLEPIAGAVRLTGAAVAVLVEGDAGSAAKLRIVPGDGSMGGMVTLGLEPPTVLLGSSGFGLELPDGVTIDASGDAAAPGTTVVAGLTLDTEADDPAWQGLVARHARLFLPRSIGRLGGRAVDAYVAVGTEPAGVDLAVHTVWEPADGGPAVDVLVECRDPSARGLQDLVPTLVEASMTLPVAETPYQVGGAALSVAAGGPVVARARFARAVADLTTKLTLGLESQGPDGILSVRAPEGGVPARAVIGAGALATALIADDPPAGSDASGSGLHALLVVATALSSLLQDRGRLTVNAVELASEGGGVPVGEAVRLELDYSVDVLVVPITVGVLSVTMRDEQPMRVRNRHVVLTYDPARDGLDRFRLDFSRADMEIEDPGAWRVDGPASLFDVLGSRSGRGSIWLEVDLKFKVNLGPVKISGATIRATRAEDGTVSASLRGLAAVLDVPGIVAGSGAFQLDPGGSFGAQLDVTLVPLNLAAGATLVYRPDDGGFFLRLAADLPGPIPLANSGIGLYGVAGSFGYGVRPTRPPAGHPDPVGFQLAWDSGKPESWASSPGDLTVGAELVIGTLPDLGFSFSTKGGIFLTVPDTAVRGALWGTVLSPRMRVTDRPSGAGAGLSFRGVVVVDSRDGVTIGLEGSLVVPVLLEARVPLGAHFSTGNDASRWFVNLGADGYLNPARVDGRASGPMRATVLPDLIPQNADAYLMLQGHGIDKWPRGQTGSLTISDGFVLAFGFGFGYTLGVKPVVWAEVHARLDVLLATRPMTLAGFGHVGGSLNLGPFSIGVDADLRFLVAENADPYVHARLCGRIDLFFTEIEGCVEISIHNPPSRVVPPPDVHPLDDVENGRVVGDQAHLIDDHYRRLAPLARTAAEALAHPVWPDTLLHLGFGRSPRLAAGFSGGQFPAVEQYPSGLAAQPVGSSMLSYDWDLTGLSLSDVTGDPDGPGALVAGELSGAWQVGKDGDTGVRPQAGDVVLLTYQGDLWLDRLADGGATLPDDPIGAAGRFCETEPDPGPTWAVGWGARGAGGLLDLPPDPVHPDPRLTPWTATARLTWSMLPDEPLSTLTGDRLPPGHRYRPPSFTAGEYRLKDRSFDGILELGGVSGPPEDHEAANTATIHPSEPITGGRLWLAFPRLDRGEREGAVLEVRDDRHGPWEVANDEVRMDDGRVAWLFVPKHGQAVREVHLAWPLGAPLGLFGLGGTGESAVRVRQTRRDARAILADVQLQAAQTQPQPPGTTTGTGARCILQPGRLYRLDVAMSWSGRLFEQDEDGTRTEVASLADQTTYRPAGGADVSTTRSYYFATTERPSPGLFVPVTGSGASLSFIHLKQDAFHPDMLARHLAGYTPAQSEPFRFCDDPLQAHFTVSHVASLAAAYGYGLRIGVRRVDAPGTDGEVRFPLTSLIAMAAPHLLRPADRRRVDAALRAPCAMPRPGATLQALAPLAPQAWYEVFIDVPGGGGLHDGRLPGITFRTSRWREPGEMVAALGFAEVPAPATGDVPVRQVTNVLTGGVTRSDGDFQRAMSQLGLDGWPVAEQPRTSLLWTELGAGTWGLLGLLLESPEPVIRPGRCDVLAPTALGGTPVMQLAASDRIASRLLFAASTVQVPLAPGAFTLRLGEHTGAVVTGSLAVPTAPAFALSLTSTP